MLRNFYVGNRGGGVASTITRTYAQISSGLVGTIDSVRTAGRYHLLAGQITPLVLYIKGSDASAWMYHTGGYGSAAGLLEVSVDGGATVVPTGVSNKFPLFAGLSDTLHKVVITVGAAYGANAYYLSTGSVIETTGVSPYVLTAAYQLQRGTSGSGAVWSSPTVAAPANCVPATAITTCTVTTVSAVPSVKFRSSSAYIDVTSQGFYFAVSIDGAAPTYYATGYTNASKKTGTTRIATSGTHDYYIWSVNSALSTTTQWTLSIGLDAAPTSVTGKRIHQYGDSITFGASGTSTAHTDVMRVAANFGHVGSSYGISGQTSTTLVTNVVDQAAKAGGDVGQDIAVLAIGRNDASFSSTNFDSIVATLLTYYAKVLVRGVLETGTSFTAFNADMSAWVTGKSDARIIYIDPEAWTGIATADGVHPTDAGYVTLANYCITDYAPHV